MLWIILSFWLLRIFVYIICFHVRLYSTFENKLLTCIVFICSIPKDIYYDHASEQAARNKEEESQKLPQQSKYWCTI